MGAAAEARRLDTGGADAVTLVFLLALLWSAPTTHAAVIAGISFDEANDATGTATDSFLFTEAGTLNEDQDIGLSLTFCHGDTNGGPPEDSSKRCVRVDTTSGEAAYYDLLPTILPADLSTISASFSAHIPTGGEVTLAKPLACFLEETTSDYGCCIVAEPGRLYSVAYFGTDEGACADSDDGDCGADEKCYGTVCRKVWGTTTETAQVERCSNALDTPCTDATVATDCPADATCDGVYSPVLRLAQVRNASNIVTCEGWYKGDPISTGGPKEVAASTVGLVNDDGTSGFRLGFSNPTGVALTSTGTIHLDSLVFDDTTNPGRNYVAGMKPDALGAGETCDDCLAESWVVDTCRSASHYDCINDYAIASNYTYDAGTTTNNVIRSRVANRRYDFPRFTPAWTPRSGETVAAVDLYAFGRKVGSAGTVEFRVSTLVCPPDPNDATNVECVVEENAATLTMSNLSEYNTPRFLQRHLTLAPPNDDPSWAPYVGNIGARINTMAGSINRYVGALQANVVVTRPDSTTPPTLTDRNQDGVIVIATTGASTLQGTSSGVCVGGSLDGDTCTYDTHCAYDPTGDQPAGGCGAAGAQDICEVCTIDAGINCATNGDADCDLGPCGGDLLCDISGADCATDDDCDVGPCVTGSAALCVDSCPADGEGDGICAKPDSGWATPIIEQVPADIVYACALGGETSGQGLLRFDKISHGRAIGYDDGGVLDCSTPSTASCCFIRVGAGVCECTVGTQEADCGTSGTCGADGRCATAPNATGRLACTQGAHCNQSAGRACKVPNPDEIIIGHGVNDTIVMFEQPAGPRYYGFDSECATKTSYVGNADTFTIGDTPVTWCPEFGTDPYEVPATACALDSTCTAGVAHDSACVGLCRNATLTTCSEDGDCAGVASGAVCFVNAPVCDVDADCDDNRSCVGGPSASGVDDLRPTLPGVSNVGRCACESDAECPDNYLCVGPVAGPKFCRMRCGCTENADCPSGTCSAGVCSSGSTVGCGTTGVTCDATVCAVSGQCDALVGDNADYKVCQGRCVGTCSAIPCDSDAKCGSTTFDERWGAELLGPDRTLTMQGKCNFATGRCTCCGAVNCLDHPDIMTRGCSCDADADCGDGETCDEASGECTSGDRSDCELDSQCAPGHRCLRCSEQLRAYAASHYGLLADVGERAAKHLTRDFYYGECANGMCSIDTGRSCTTNADCDHRPGLSIYAVPLPSGLSTTGDVFPDIACYQRNAAQNGQWIDRAYYASTYHMSIPGIPAHRIIYPTDYNTRRMYEAFVADQVHNPREGALVVGEPAVDMLNALDTCVDADGVAVGYCQREDLDFPERCTCDSDGECGGGGDCVNGLCIVGTASRVVCDEDADCDTGETCTGATLCTDADTDCAAGESCNFKKCHQDAAANCLGAASCGAD